MKHQRPESTIFNIVLILVMLVSSLLVACSPWWTEQVKCQMIKNNPQSSLGDKTKCFFAEIAWSIASLPVVGPAMEWVLRKINSESHWIVGVVIVVLLISAMGGAASSGARQQK